MTNLTIAVPDELHGKMKGLSEIRWSEVARKAFEEKILEMEIAEKIANKSKLSNADVEKLADIIDSKTLEKIKRKCA